MFARDVRFLAVGLAAGALLGSLATLARPSAPHRPGGPDGEAIGTVVVLVAPDLEGGSTVAIDPPHAPGGSRWVYRFADAGQARECRDRGLAAMNAYRITLPIPTDD